jgi:hypothetical protein
MRIFDTFLESPPYRLLLITTLSVVVVALAIAMAMVTHAQVQKAQAHYAAQNEAGMAGSSTATRAGSGRRKSAEDSVVNARIALSH